MADSRIKDLNNAIASYTELDGTEGFQVDKDGWTNAKLLALSIIQELFDYRYRQFKVDTIDDDFNLYWANGQYHVSGTDIANAPYSGNCYGFCNTFISQSRTHNGSTYWGWQWFTSTSGAVWYRQYINAGPATSWVQLSSLSNLYEAGEALSSIYLAISDAETDYVQKLVGIVSSAALFGTALTNGYYLVAGGSGISDGPTPFVSSSCYGILEVFNQPDLTHNGTNNFGFQRLFTVSGTVWERRKINSASFTNWLQLRDDDNLYEGGAALSTLYEAIGTAASAISSHESDTTAHPASSIVNTPAGNIEATDVQDAINELDTEKSDISHAHTGIYQPADANLTTWAGKTAPSGAVVGTTDTQTLTNKDFIQRYQSISAGATPTWAFASGMWGFLQLTENAVMQNPTIGGITNANGFLYLVLNGYTISWSANWNWIGTEPALGTSGIVLFDVFIRDSQVYIEYLGKVGSDGQAHLAQNQAWIGAQDFGDADSLEAPNGAGGTTLNDAGEVCIDTTSKTFNFYSDQEYAISPIRQFSILIESPADTDDIPIMRFDVASTILKVVYAISGGTNWVGQIQEADDAQGTNGTDCQASDSTVTDTTTVTSFSNASFDAGDYCRLKSSSISGSVSWLHITVYYVQNP